MLDAGCQGKEILLFADKSLLKRLDRFDDFIKDSQGFERYGGLDYDDLCMLPDPSYCLNLKFLSFLSITVLEIS